MITAWSPRGHPVITAWSPHDHLVVTSWSPRGHPECLSVVIYQRMRQRLDPYKLGDRASW